ncbi:hypothetical protein [Sphingobacterium anhuiense]|uniref:hypothetical protein n=1 Tax=Sphingobacterium anhuiense TaxID=493780 RepID=UPI003C2E75A6
MYNKNQFFFILITLSFFMYAMFHYLRYHGLDFVNNVKEVTVLNTTCTAAPRMASGMNISFQNKDYSINLPYEDCSRYSAGDKVGLLYDKKYDQFYLLDSVKVLRYRVIFVGCVLLTLIIPWKYLVKRFNFLKF